VIPIPLLPFSLSLSFSIVFRSLSPSCFQAQAPTCSADHGAFVPFLLCALGSASRKAPPYPSETDSLSLSAHETIPFFLFLSPILLPQNSAGAAATLRPATTRPFLLADVFKGGEEEAGATAGAGAGGASSNASASTSSGDASHPSSTDGVAAATAAVLSLSLGATLGSVSDAAVTRAALRPNGTREEGKNRENDDEGNDGADNADDAADDEMNEWLARHTVDFLDAAALLQSALAHQYCTRETCPAMRAGPRHEYLWAEPEIPGGGERRAEEATSSAAAMKPKKPATAAITPSTKNKPSRLPACDYTSALFSWADSLLACPLAFPQAKGETFPKHFKQMILQPLYRRLARVFAHFYFAHWQQLASRSCLGASAHLTTVFKHYVAFGREHALLPEGELDPMRPLVEALLPIPSKEGKKKEGEKKREEEGELLSSKSSKSKSKARVEVSASSAAAFS